MNLQTRRSSPLLALCVAVLASTSFVNPTTADMHFYPPYSSSGYLEGGPDISDQFVSGTANASTGRLTAEAITGSWMTQPWGRAWIDRTWDPGPQDAGRVAVTVAGYTKDFTLECGTDGVGGGSTGRIFLNLIVFEGDVDNEIGRIMVERSLKTCMSLFPILGFSSHQDSLIFIARADRDYVFRVELEVEALQFEECDNTGSDCDTGWADITATADIDHIAVITSNRPWTSVAFVQPRGSMMRDTWDAYERMRYTAERRTYYPSVATIALDAGGYYDDQQSELVFTCPGDSIIGFTANPRDFGWDLSSTPDSLRLKIPQVYSQESWTITVNIAPEIDEGDMIACATAYPLKAIWRHATGCSIAIAALGITYDEFFDGGHWVVRDPSGGLWHPLADAVRDGGNYEIIDPGDVAWIDPGNPLDQIPGWDQIGFIPPEDPDLIRIDMQEHCRGIDPFTMQYTRWPMGENSYVEDRVWRVDVDLEGRNEYQGVHIHQDDRQKWQVNFDYYPVERSYSINDVPVVHASKLEPNIPNPFNPVTTISFNLTAAGSVRLRICDMLGHVVATLIDDFRAPGRHESVFTALDQNGSPLSSGVYLCVLEAEGRRWSRTMTLVR